MQALGKVHALYRRSKGIFSLFFKIKHRLFCPFHKLSFPFSHLKAKCFHLMFCFLDRIHCKELNLAFLHHTQLFLHLTQFLQYSSQLHFHGVNIVCHTDHIPFFLLHALLFQQLQQCPDTALLPKRFFCFRNLCAFFFHLHSLLPKWALPENFQQHLKIYLSSIHQVSLSSNDTASYSLGNCSQMALSFQSNGSALFLRLHW